MEIPNLNLRIKKLIELQTNGVVKKFAECIAMPQQTINRLFIIDKRTGKYPVATTDILIRISEMYDDISTKWLLTGEGEMLRENATPKQEIHPQNASQNIFFDIDGCRLCKEKERLLDAMKETIAAQKEAISTLKIALKKAQRDAELAIDAAAIKPRGQTA